MGQTSPALILHPPKGRRSRTSIHPPYRPTRRSWAERPSAGIPESITADIVGHEKKTITYGLYSGGSSMLQKIEAIEKIKY